MPATTLRRRQYKNPSIDKRYVKYRNNGDHDPLTLYEMIAKYQSAGEPVICKHFGCGTPLNDLEQLAGHVCNVHSGEESVNKTLVSFFSALK